MDQNSIPRIHISGPLRRYEDFNLLVKMRIENNMSALDPDYDFSSEPKMLNNDDIIQMLEKAGTIRPLAKQVEFIFNNTGKDLLFRQVFFQIDGKEFLYGIDIQDDLTAQEIGDFLLSKLVEGELLCEKEQIERSLATCANDHQKKELLEERLKNATSNYKRYTFLHETGGQEPGEKLIADHSGYQSARLNGRPRFLKTLTEEIFEATMSGVVSYKVSQFIGELLHDFDEKSSQNSDAKNLINSKISQLKLRWLAGKDDFAELIYTLIDKGYIEDFHVAGLERKYYVESLFNTFDLSNSSKRDDSNTLDNFYQSFKDENKDKIMSRRDAKKKFGLIKSNTYVSKRQKKQS